MIRLGKNQSLFQYFNPFFFLIHISLSSFGDDNGPWRCNLVIKIDDFFSNLSLLDSFVVANMAEGVEFYFPSGNKSRVVAQYLNVIHGGLYYACRKTKNPTLTFSCSK